MKILFPLLAYILIGAFEVAGDVLGKKWADGEGASFLVICMGLYTISGLLFAVSLKFQELTTAAIMFGAVSTIVTIAFGHYLFQEEIGTLQIVMIGLLMVVFGLQIYESLTE